MTESIRVGMIETMRTRQVADLLNVSVHQLNKASSTGFLNGLKAPKRSTIARPAFYAMSEVADYQRRWKEFREGYLSLKEMAHELKISRNHLNTCCYNKKEIWGFPFPETHQFPNGRVYVAAQDFNALKQKINEKILEF